MRMTCLAIRAMRQAEGLPRAGQLAGFRERQSGARGSTSRTYLLAKPLAKTFTGAGASGQSAPVANPLVSLPRSS